MRNALIVGASSGVGRALIEKLAKNNCDLILCARSSRDLEANATDVILRFGTKVKFAALDINDKDQRSELISLAVKIGNITDLFITIGDIADNDNGLQDYHSIDSLVNSNFLSIIMFISGVLKKSGTNGKLNIVLLSSIAISRPRKNNLVYAASKAAVDFYFRGMQHLFVNTNVNIIIFRLGYIDTAMSYGKKLLLHPVSPIKTADYILSKLNTRKRIYYYPWYWRYFTIIIRLIPWIIYKRLSF
ncbi:SDR family NAD(P)-dependent oxidoreductase [candidate division KSB1 bacterium]